MEPRKKSKLYDSINEAVISGKLKEPFTVADINRVCDGLLSKSSAFLSKHAKNNPGGCSELFTRVNKGTYVLNK